MATVKSKLRRIAPQMQRPPWANKSTFMKLNSEAAIKRNEPERQSPYPAEKARGGVIILRTPLRRAIFIGGLAGAVILGLLLTLLR
jgi:hypothetical protein